MIVVITSWAPVVALRNPAIPAQAAPASVAASIAMITCSGPGSPLNQIPNWTATSAPTVYWPFPPMLKSPHRKAKATARPVRISGVTMIRVCCRLSAVRLLVSQPVHSTPFG